MISYFVLQAKMLLRKLKDNGFNPIVTLIAAALGFIYASAWLFQTTTYAKHLVVFFAGMYSVRLSEKSRNQFLQTCFSTPKYYLVRVVENTLLNLPFCFVLMYQRQWLFAGLLVLLALLFALFPLNHAFNKTMPTPFGKYPFAFVVGFRKSYLFLLIPYFLAVMAVLYDNFNICIISTLLVFGITMSFYSKPESPFYVWIYNCRPQAFLKEQILLAFWQSFMLTSPIFVLSGLFFFEKWVLLLISTLLGFGFLSAMILAKYAAFPEEINLSQGIVFMLSLYFPPLMVVLIPYFYKQAVRKLTTILPDDTTH